MGLTNLTYGLYGGVVAFAVPQLLAARHVPEPAIAGLTAITFSPGFWAFLFSPTLDVRFSRRWYAVMLALVAAATLVIAFLNLGNFLLLEIVLTAGFFAVYLYQSAIGGWLSSITTAEEEKTVSIWITVGNVGGFGLMAVCCNQLVRHLPPLAAALILGGSVLVPTLVFPFMQAPGPDRRLASESFSQFFGDLVQLVQRREVLIAVILFLAPAGTFSLTNFLGSRGDDFHASPGFVGLIGGVGVAAGGILGCFLFKPLQRLMPLRPLYLTVGLVGGLMTLALILLPHKPPSFAILLIGENIVQSLAITVSMGVIFETIGRDNPLASTTFCFISSAYGVPIWYMLYVDAFGFTKGGIAGSLAIDALAGIAASLLLFGMLWILERRSAAALPITG
jgi:PAT family beta-lactamase induction signal transducer AmpG